MTRLTLNLLGPFEAQLESTPLTGFRSVKNQVLLAYVALEAQPHLRLTLADLLWPDVAEETARGNLRQALFQLRTLLQPTAETAAVNFLEITPKTVQFQRASCHTVDALTFTALYETCNQHSHASLADCASCMEHYTQAAALYRGDFLAGIYLDDSPGLEEWIGWRRQQFAIQAWRLLHTLAGWHEAQQHHALAQQYAQRLIELDDLREEGHGLLMRALARNGQPDEALAHYQRFQRHLAKELAAEPSPALQELQQAIKQGTFPVAPPLTVTVPTLSAPVAPPPLTSQLRHNLPPLANHFVSRPEEQLLLHELLADPNCRLVTLTGPGGVGKTRLALETAWQLVSPSSAINALALSSSGQPTLGHRWPDGIWLVELAAVQQGEEMVLAILRTLGLVRQEKVEPAQQLLAYLQTRRLLLILDNFEQLSEASLLVAAWLERAPHVTVIVTSRHRLRLQAEHVVVLDGLPTPVGIADGDALGYASVQLFIARARQVWQRFTGDSATLPAVVSLCQLMEGLPLGLELAAGWVDERSCAELVALVEQSYAALTAAMRDVPPRQRSLRAIFESSWGLLNRAEQHALARLALIQGDFTGDAATVVGATNPLTLIALVHKSLVRTVAADRYQLHGLVRELAGAKLAATPDGLAEARARFSRYYLALVAAQTEALVGSDPLGAAGTLEALLPNLQQAWQWAVDAQAVGALNQALTALAEFYELSGRYCEAAQVVQQALAALSPAQIAPVPPAEREDYSELYAELHLQAIRFYTLLGEPRNAVQLGEATLALAERSKRADQLPQACLYLGAAHYQLGDPQQAIQLYEEALALTDATPSGRAAQRLHARCRFVLGDLLIFRQEQRGIELLQTALHSYQELGDQRNEAWVRNSLGVAAYLVRDYAAGRAALEAARHLCQALGDRYREARVLNNLANIYAALNDYPASDEALQAALQVAEASGNRPSMVNALVNLGINQLDQGNRAGARAYYEQALAHVQSGGLVRSHGVILNNLGEILRQEGDLVTAESYLRQAVTLARQYQERHYETIRLKNLGVILRDQGRDDEAKVYLTEAIAVADQIEDRVTSSEALLQLGNLAQRAGQRSEALLYWQQAMRVAQQGDHQPCYEEAQTLLAQATQAIANP